MKLVLASVSSTRHLAFVATPSLKVIVEQHPDGFVAYPLGLERGVIIGQGDSFEEAMSDIRSAIAFHLESFDPESLALSTDEAVLDAFVADALIPC